MLLKRKVLIMWKGVNRRQKIGSPMSRFMLDNPVLSAPPPPDAADPKNGRARSLALPTTAGCGPSRQPAEAGRAGLENEYVC